MNTDNFFNWKQGYTSWTYKKSNKNTIRYSAGILPYTFDQNGKLLFLLGKDNDGDWSDFGGRCEFKDRNEPKNTATREFYEETRINKHDIQILENINPFEEIFFGTNGIMYKHVYYIAKLINEDLEVKVDENCIEQIREIRAIKWYNSSEVISHIKSYYIERIELFKFANKKILEYEKLLI